MSLVLQSSGGGQITIQEPATASNFTATLPAADGTIVVSGTTPTLNGITFPATQVPSADANTLDDYEEGTWTPSAATGFPSGFTSITATYTKIGRLVTVSALATCTTDGTTIQIGGLPFAPNHNGGVVSAYWGSNVLRAGITSSFGGYINLLTSGTFSSTAVYFGATYEV
jgi:hypothetical protein